jgi:hypothetical protein
VRARFARYADDSNIYVRSRRAGKRVMESITRFISLQLKLTVNQQKSAVARPWRRKFLGFSFTVDREPKRRMAPKAVLRFKERVRKTDETDPRCEHGAEPEFVLYRLKSQRDGLRNDWRTCSRYRRPVPY